MKLGVMGQTRQGVNKPGFSFDFILLSQLVLSTFSFFKIMFLKVKMKFYWSTGVLIKFIKLLYYKNDGITKISISA